MAELAGQADQGEKKHMVICGGAGYVTFDDLYAYKHINVIKHTYYYIKEFAILTKLQKYNHSNIIQILDTKYKKCLERTKTETETNENLYMIIKYKKYSRDLYDYTCTNDLVLVQIIIDILSAVHLMHINNIMHRDIKLDNILFDNSRAIIIDFSHARYNNRYLYCNDTVQTPGYRAPEILNFKRNNIYNEKIDIWGVGVVLHDIICSSYLYNIVACVSNKTTSSNKNHIDFFNNVYGDYFKLIEKYYNKDDSKLLHKSEYLKWIKQMLAFKPSDRPSADEMLKTILTFASCNGLDVVLPVWNNSIVDEPLDKPLEQPLDKPLEQPLNIVYSSKSIRNLIISVSIDIDSKMTCDDIDEYAIEIVETILTKLTNCNYITVENYQYVVTVCVVIVDALHFDGNGSIDECCANIDNYIEDDEMIAYHIFNLLTIHGELFF